MQLNTIKPAAGAKKDAKRAGRGIGSGLGKTGGRGHKGQKSRSGGYHKIGFEGGQMPIQRRLPKVGFSSRVGQEVDEIRLNELSKVDGSAVNIETLRKAGLINKKIKRVKIILSGEVSKAFTISNQDIAVTKGAREAIEKAGGKVE